MAFKEYEMVKLKRNIGSMPAGSVGTIVFVHHDPRVAYIMEFLDADGNTLDLITVEEADVETNQ
ncbi:DUF4926 domain-containing protein [Leptospira neocaledonica]|uniref:DUF4926 domain-containing protein n=2 Tax=Leptospira neocaledonica TaxID=2023192 RepID=A0A2M9ZUT0_9LEPT|nr:DUF4926 domain-containing protein [Leptospira neocaledonica]